MIFFHYIFVGTKSNPQNATPQPPLLKGSRGGAVYVTFRPSSKSLSILRILSLLLAGIQKLGKDSVSATPGSLLY